MTTNKNNWLILVLEFIFSGFEFPDDKTISGFVSIYTLREENTILTCRITSWFVDDGSITKTDSSFISTEPFIETTIWMNFVITNWNESFYFDSSRFKKSFPFQFQWISYLRMKIQIE